MRRTRLVAVIFIVMVLAAPVAPAAGQEQRNPSPQQVQLQDLRRLGNKWIRPTGHYRWTDLVQLELRERSLELALSPQAAAGVLRGERKVAVEIEGSEALWVVTSEGRVWLDAQRRIASHHLTATATFDRGASPDRLHLKLLRSTPQNLMMLAFGDIAGRRLETQFMVLPEARRVHLQVVELQRGQRQAIFDAAAADLLKLLQDHPAEVREYLVPMLMQLCGENPLRPGAAEVYAAFSEIPADSSTMEAVEQIVARLDAPDPRQRQRAMSELRALGPPAVLALMRMDDPHFSLEQAARVEHFLAAHRRGGIDPAAARRDPFFLIDCALDPDPAVRAAAEAKLAEMFDRQLALSPSMSDEMRLMRLMRVYREGGR